MSLLSKRSIIRSLVAAGAFPDTVKLVRSDAVRWVEGDLEYGAWVDRRGSNTDTLSCTVNIGDRKFGERMDEFGRLAVLIRAVDGNEIPWPTGRKLNESQILYMKREFDAASNFVLDRVDLCRLLMSKEHVYRNEHYAWLTDASLPARLVMALIVARDLGDAGLEAEAVEKLRSERLTWSSPSGNDMVSVARDWAKQYAKALGQPIHLPSL